MDRMASLCMYMAIFLLTWSSAVRGIPKTRDRQCKDLGYDVACKFHDIDKPCEILRCGRETNRNIFEIFPQILRHGVPDGTECGQSKICMKKKCVPVAGPMPHHLGSRKLVQCHRRSLECNRQLLTRTEQCQEYGFDVACQYTGAKAGSSTMCKYLLCGYKEREGLYFKHLRKDVPMGMAPMTGTRCGDNQICFRQMCIPLSEWPKSELIPNYTVPEITEKCLKLKT